MLYESRLSSQGKFFFRDSSIAYGACQNLDIRIECRMRNIVINIFESLHNFLILPQTTLSISLFLLLDDAR